MECERPEVGCLKSTSLLSAFVGLLARVTPHVGLDGALVSCRKAAQGTCKGSFARVTSLVCGHCRGLSSCEGAACNVASIAPPIVGLHMHAHGLTMHSGEGAARVRALHHVARRREAKRVSAAALGVEASLDVGRKPAALRPSHTLPPPVQDVGPLGRCRPARMEWNGCRVVEMRCWECRLWRGGSRAIPGGDLFSSELQPSAPALTRPRT